MGTTTGNVSGNAAGAFDEQSIEGDENLVIPSGPAIGSDDIAHPEVPTRTEVDSLGTRAIPETAYWGIHTARALDNFPITLRAIYNYPDLINAFARVK